jgi:hypothetical protein
MPSSMRLALISLSILASTALPLSGCVTARPLLVQQSACSSLIPPSLRADVESVDPPALNATVGDVWSAFDGQTGRLDTSNTYRTAAIGIVEACEVRDRQAAEQITRPWWQFW